MSSSNLFSNSVLPPCKGCEDRALRCHSVCSKYIQYKKDRDDYTKKLKAIRDKEHEISSYVEQSIRRQSRRNGTTVR